MIKALLAIFLLFPASAGALTLEDLRTESRRLAMDQGVRVRFSTTSIDVYLNEAQRIAVVDTMAIYKSKDFELAIGTTYYDLPSDYLNMRRLSIDYQDLDEVTAEYLSNRASLEWEEVGGRPINYFINFASRTKVGMYPFPDTSTSTGTIRYEYYSQSTDMSATTDQPFDSITELVPYHYMLAFYAAFRMTAIDGRADLATLYRTEFYEGLARMKREAVARPSYRPSARPASRSRRGQ